MNQQVESSFCTGEQKLRTERTLRCRRKWITCFCSASLHLWGPDPLHASHGGGFLPRQLAPGPQAAQEPSDSLVVKSYSWSVAYLSASSTKPALFCFQQKPSKDISVAGFQWKFSGHLSTSLWKGFGKLQGENTLCIFNCRFCCPLCLLASNPETVTGGALILVNINEAGELNIRLYQSISRSSVPTQGLCGPRLKPRKQDTTCCSRYPSKRNKNDSSLRWDHSVFNEHFYRDKPLLNREIWLQNHLPDFELHINADAEE